MATKKKVTKLPKHGLKLESDFPADRLAKMDQRIEIPPNPSEAGNGGKFKPRKRRTGLELDAARNGPMRLVLRDVVSKQMKNGDLKVSGVAIDDGFVDPVTESQDGHRKFSVTLKAAKLRGKSRDEIGAVISAAVEEALPAQGGVE